MRSLDRRWTLALCLVGAACASVPSAPSSESPLDRAAEEYVRLTLAVGSHDPLYVDAYYGPAAWAEAAKREAVPLRDIATRSQNLIQRLDSMASPLDVQGAQRRRFLLLQTRTLEARVGLLLGEKHTFDEESQMLFAAQAPRYAEAEFLAIHAQLEKLLPGPGPLSDRVEQFNLRFVIPKEKLTEAFDAAIAEARRRTAKYVTLPKNETLRLELVSNKTWTGYNWYQGNATSLLQFNVDLPMFAAKALSVGAHESYPGHHVYNALLEQHLVRERGWVEFTVYPLFSPQSVIAEGSADYGVDLVFPDAAEFLEKTIFPIAGLNTAEVRRYVEVDALQRRLVHADIEAARQYLDGTLTAEQTRDYLVKYRLNGRDRAAKYVTNIDALRSYVINYGFGRDLVAQFVDRQTGPNASSEQKWRAFEALLSSPMLPPDLVEQQH